eukprot:CAMPEP_0113846380 /NCGR_PEP_ID=MMETSP0372-20130328/1276_1 /TAXON_ID=340204 /ORGANISM="Lankesteria abbotti" /LENGTH=228 /DNA_ID=CAMNT_0000815519 /DNA_START=1309 /DNA_END=1992 /DNA_ORIENTATION=- /assembly_acc=CAM_ASM_000359
MSPNNIHTIMSPNNIHIIMSPNKIHTIMSQNNIHIIMSQNNIHTIMSQNNIHTIMSQNNIHTIMSQKTIHTIMSQNNIHMIVSQKNIHIIISQNNIQTIISHNNVQTIKLELHRVFWVWRFLHSVHRFLLQHLYRTVLNDDALLTQASDFHVERENRLPLTVDNLTEVEIAALAALMTFAMLAGSTSKAISLLRLLSNVTDSSKKISLSESLTTNKNSSGRWALRITP